MDSQYFLLINNFERFMHSNDILNNFICMQYIFFFYLSHFQKYKEKYHHYYPNYTFITLLILPKIKHLAQNSLTFLLYMIWFRSNYIFHIYSWFNNVVLLWLLNTSTYFLLSDKRQNVWFSQINLFYFDQKFGRNKFILYEQNYH